MYRLKDGTSYELPGTYQGTYPGATTDSTSVQLDSTTITIAGQPTPQQMSFQLPGSDHPATKDLFEAQADPDPRSIAVAFQPRTLYPKPSGKTVEVAIAANGAITLSGSDLASENIGAELLPINAALVVDGQGGAEVGHVIASGIYDKTAGTGLVAHVDGAVTKVALKRTIVPGLQFGPFLADINSVGPVDDSGSMMYAVSFTPVNIVQAPSRLLTPVGQQDA